ncbi:MAG: hypothetical protein ACTSU2_08240 [Promethearchaeota archaeon]
MNSVIRTQIIPTLFFPHLNTLNITIFEIFQTLIVVMIFLVLFMISILRFKKKEYSLREGIMYILYLEAGNVLNLFLFYLMFFGVAVGILLAFLILFSMPLLILFINVPENSPKTEDKGDINERFMGNEEGNKDKEGVSKENVYKSKESRRSKKGHSRMVFEGDKMIKFEDIFLFYVNYLLSYVLSVIITSAVLTLMGVECVFIFS